MSKDVARVAIERASGRQMEQRVGVLRSVYREFDLDGGGDVGEDELFALGTARRKLGQKTSSWTKGQNETMMRNMGCDKEMNVSMESFVKYFNEKLASTDDKEFAETMKQFSTCAKSCNVKKTEARKEAKEKEKKQKATEEAASRSAAQHRAEEEAAQRRKAAERQKADDDAAKRQKVLEDEARRSSRTTPQLSNRKLETTPQRDSKALKSKLDGHTDYVISCQFGPKGDSIVSASHDKTIKVYSYPGGECTHTLVGHTESIYDSDIAPDGDTVVSASHDRSLRLWSLKTGKWFKQLNGHKAPVRSCEFSPCGEFVVSGGYDSKVKLWRAADGECISTMHGHTGFVRSVSFSADGNKIASGGDDQTVRVWDTGGACLKIISDHSDTVMGTAFSPDNQYLASCGYDNTVRIYSSKSLSCLQVLQGQGEGHVFSVTFSFDSNQLATSGDDLAVRVWDLKSGKCVAKMKGHDKSVFSCSFSPDRMVLASASHDRSIRLWDLAIAYSERDRSPLSPRSPIIQTRVTDKDRKAANEDNAQAVRQRSNVPQRRRNVPNGTGCNSVAHSDSYIKTLNGHQGYVISVAFSPDGSMLATGSHDKTVKLWSFPAGECISTFKGHTETVYCVAFSPTDTLLASASHDRTIRLWDWRNKQTSGVLLGHRKPVRACAFSPDGAVLASVGYDCTVRLWSCPDGMPTMTLEGHSAFLRCVAFSPDGTTVASGGDDNTVRLWSTKNGRSLGVLRDHKEYVYGVSFSVDGTTLASAGYDNTIQLYNWKSKTRIRSVAAHDTMVFCLEFSSLWGDGRAMASSGDDKTVRVWDTASAQQVAVLKGHSNSVFSCAFSPTLPILVSASHDNTLKLWDLMKAAKEIASRPASPTRATRASKLMASPMPLESPSPPKGASNNRSRETMLREVFAVFDLDGEGTVDTAELLKLGKARRSLGQKSGEWNEEKNARLVRRMDSNRDGTIQEDEFASFFNASLPQDLDDFSAIMKQFHQVALECRQGKQEQKSKAASIKAREYAKKTRDEMSPLKKKAELPHKTPALSSSAIRSHVIGEVFDLFDLDGLGTVQADELLLLGQARRTLGQKTGTWDEEKNKKFMAKIDKDGSGDCDRDEFVAHFSKALPFDQDQFSTIMHQFMGVARDVRGRKQRGEKVTAPRQETKAARDVTPESSPEAEPSRHTPTGQIERAMARRKAKQDAATAEAEPEEAATGNREEHAGHRNRAAEAAAEKAEAERVAKVHQTFEAIDADQNGSITLGELRQSVKVLYVNLGIEKGGLTLGKMIKLFNSVMESDKDDSGMMDLHEFADFAQRLMQRCKQHEESR